MHAGFSGQVLRRLYVKICPNLQFYRVQQGGPSLALLPSLPYNVNALFIGAVQLFFPQIYLYRPSTVRTGPMKLSHPG